MEKKILVTGATGSLGHQVIDFLKQKTDVSNIAAMVRDGKGDHATHYRNERIEVRIGDYADTESLEKAFAAIDILYFVSGSDDDQRVRLHKNVVDAAKKAGVKHIVYTSAVWKDNDSTAPLAHLVDSHRQTENAIIESGMDYTILKHNLYTEVINMLIGDREQLLKSKTIYLPAGNGSASFVPKKDLAEAAALILLNPSAYTHQTLEFNGNHPIGFQEIAEIISGIIQEPVQFVSPEPEEFKRTMASYGLPRPVIEILNTFSTAIGNGEFNQQSTDLEMILERETGSVTEYLKATYENNEI